MRKLMLLVSVFLLTTGCDDNDDVKDDVIRLNLEDAVARYDQPYVLDIDHNGDSEFVFTTLLVADDLGDHLQFRIVSRHDHAVIGHDDRVDALDPGKTIVADDQFDPDVSVLVVKTTTNEGTEWPGPWNDTQNKYAGIRFRLHEQRYYGWIRLSFDRSAEELILHDMGYGRPGIVTGK